MEAGADRQKLVLGIPTYGRSYTLFNAESNELGAPADGPGEMGEATKEKGYLAYYEICENIKKDPSWKVVQPNPKAMGPYAYKDDQWVGYDDESIVRLKAKYVAEQDLGGIMFWSIDNDDFRGNCHGRPYPLIEAAKEALIESSSNLIISSEEIPSSRTRTRLTTTRTEYRSNSGGRQSLEVSGDRNRVRGGSRYTVKVEPEVVTTTTRRKVTNRAQGRQRRPDSRRRTRPTEAPTTITSTTPIWNTTPAPPVTPDSGSDFKCKDDGFFPHPTDCKKYFWCLSSGGSDLIIAHQFTCPAGL